MQVFEKSEELLNSRENFVSGTIPKMQNSKIIFYGTNNVLFCEEGVTLKNSIIEFGASNSIVFLRKNNFAYQVAFKVFNNSTIFIDSNNYFNGVLHAEISEETNLFIGKGGMFSHSIWMMTSDSHLVYDIDSLNRLNFSKSIYIGDHVWIGQNTIILKGTKIYSGSIIGAASVLPGILVENNSIYAGNPAKKVRNSIFWNGTNVHKWQKRETDQSRKYDSFIEEKTDAKIDDYIYTFNKYDFISYESIESSLKNTNIKDRLAYISELIKLDNKNRFAYCPIKTIEPETKKNKNKGLR